MTPQPLKVRADVEMTCFTYDGIEHIKAAIRAAEAQVRPGPCTGLVSWAFCGQRLRGAGGRDCSDSHPGSRALMSLPRARQEGALSRAVKHTDSRRRAAGLQTVLSPPRVAASCACGACNTACGKEARAAWQCQLARTCCSGKRPSLTGAGCTGPQSCTHVRQAEWCWQCSCQACSPSRAANAWPRRQFAGTRCVDL
jgi:hypothetical protein